MVLQAIALAGAALCLHFSVADKEGRSLEAPILFKSGDIALDNWPFCDFFVVHTKDGFALMLWQRGMGVYGEGDDIYGLTDRTGQQTVLVASEIVSGHMSVNVEVNGVNLPHAQAAFYKRCKIQ